MIKVSLVNFLGMELEIAFVALPRIGDHIKMHGRKSKVNHVEFDMDANKILVFCEFIY